MILFLCSIGKEVGRFVRAAPRFRHSLGPDGRTKRRARGRSGEAEEEGAGSGGLREGSTRPFGAIPNGVYHRVTGYANKISIRVQLFLHPKFRVKRIVPSKYFEDSVP